MPSHRFIKEEPKILEQLQEGDYLLEVREAEPKISNGSKTRGCAQIEMRVQAVGRGVTFFETLTFPNESTDPETAEFCNNRINTFLTSTNFGADEGQELEIEPELLEGLRGRARVMPDEYQGKKKNKVRFWYTDKEKFPRQSPPPEPVAAGEDPFESA